MSARRLALPLLLGLVFACAFTFAHAWRAPLLLMNVTPSLPEGFYVRRFREPSLGDLVAARPPAAAHAYLRELGYPADAPILKRVVAVAGARACATPSSLRVDGWTIPRQARDGAGRPIPAWGGCRALEDGEVILLGSSAASFDSRYFGPVRGSDLLDVYQALGR